MISSSASCTSRSSTTPIAPMPSPNAMPTPVTKMKRNAPSRKSSEPCPLRIVPDDGGKDGDSGSVVEQALAFEDGFQAQRRMHLAQEVDDSDRIGCGDDGAEQGAARPVEAGETVVGHGADGS